MFIKIVERISSLINYIAIWLIFALMVVGIAGVITRFGGIPISGVVNVSIFILVGAMYLSFAYAQLHKSHVAVEFFASRMSTRPRLLLTSITASLSVVACSILVWASWLYALGSCKIWECMDGAPFYPIWPVKLTVAIGASALFLQIIADFVKVVGSPQLRVRFRGDSEKPKMDEQ